MIAELLLYLPSGGVGGCETYALLLADYFARTRGVPVAIAVPDDAAAADVRRSIAASPALLLPYAVARRGWFGSFSTPAEQARQATTVLEAADPAAVLSVLPWPLAGVGMQQALRGSGVPSAVVFQLCCRRLSLPPRVRDDFISPRAQQKWIAVSRSNRKCIATTFGVAQRGIAVIPNGSPLADLAPVRPTSLQALRQQLSLPTDALLLVSLGRLTSAKGQMDAIVALSRLAAPIRERSLLLLLGDGEDRDRLSALAGELGVAGCVRFVGRVRDPVPLLLAADIFLATTRCEGLSFALIEAMACSVPIVAIAATSTNELVRPGRDALFVPAGDTSALARQIEILVEDSAMAARLAASAQRRAVRQFGAERMLARTVDALEPLGLHVRKKSPAASGVTST
jgi:glycosyltransferase involved in cell wall biosynthesis